MTRIGVASKLHIVQSELFFTLDLAQKILEGYHEGQGDLSQLPLLLDYLYQVYGCLRMIELYGAALLVEEMVNTSKALISGNTNNLQNAQAELMNSLLRLPIYLELIEEGQDDRPVLLLKQINDLRAVRNESAIEEDALFVPNLAAVERFDLPKSVDQASLLGVVKRHRQTFEKSLLYFFRGQNGTQALAIIAHVVGLLDELTAGQPAGQFWWVASAFIEALRFDGVRSMDDAKKLLGRVDREYRHLLQAKDIHNMPAPDSDSTRQLLYYIARSSCQGKKTQAVQKAFALNELLLQETELESLNKRFNAPDKSAMQTVIGVIKEEFAAVKGELDVYVRGQKHEASILESILATLRTLSDTLKLLGMNAERQVIQGQISCLQQIVAGEKVGSNSQLLDIAASLLYVETLVDERLTPVQGHVQASDNPEHDDGLSRDERMIQRALLIGAERAVLNEVRVGLGQAKSAIIMFISHVGDITRLQLIPDLMVKIAGSLAVLALEKPAQLIALCGAFIQQNILAKQTVSLDAEQLEILADIIISVDDYLERKTQNKRVVQSSLALAESRATLLSNTLQ